MDQEVSIKNDVQNKKKFLKRHQRIGKKIERLEEKLAMLDARLTTAGAQRLSDMPRGGGTPLTMADLVAEKIETEERINQLCVQRRWIRKEIVLALDTLDDFRHIEVLEKFFIEGMTLEEIAEDIGYTVRHTVRFYTEAVQHLDIKE